MYQDVMCSTDTALNNTSRSGFPPQNAESLLSIPDSAVMGLLKAWALRPQWTIWLRQWLLDAAVSTGLTTRVRISDKAEDHIPCLT
ncbi:unnamed protein product [Echinostoma caproni]|uniref:Transposase n=1 Tax=Echinostoma caproni TaxID=27848 RepID=A0A183ASA5_9TREM|nr:unnamed protein product [Echinostoma caproni]